VPAHTASTTSLTVRAALRRLVSAALNEVRGADRGSAALERRLALRAHAEPADVEQALGGVDHVPGHVQRTHDARGDGLTHQLQTRRDAGIRHLLLRLIHGDGVGFGAEIEEDCEQRRTGHPVHRRVVHLDDEADAVVGQSFDDPDLPQRLRPVELLTGDVPGQIGQLPEPAGAGHCRPPHVVLDVELGVVDPHRVAESERHLDQPPPEHRCTDGACGDELPHPGE
jgi:hypothetical protein